MFGINSLDQDVRKSIIKQDFGFSSHIDRYSKWAPFFCVLFSQSLGIKLKSPLAKRVLLLSIGEIILNAVVHPLKTFTKEKRPNFSFKNNSFPSGHSATSFMGAEILHQELKVNYPVLSYGGFTIAVLTGTLRLLNNKHWLSDVVCGAAIGFMAARISCYVLRKLENQTPVAAGIFPLRELPAIYLA